MDAIDHGRQSVRSLRAKVRIEADGVEQRFRIRVQDLFRRFAVEQT